MKSGTELHERKNDLMLGKPSATDDQVDGTMNMFRLGISSYTFAWAIGVPGHPIPDPLGVFGLLDRAAQLGVGVLQIADNLPLDQMPVDSLKRLKQSADEKAVQIEVGARGIQPPHLDRYLQIAQRFESPILRVVIDSAEHQPSVAEVIELLSVALPAFANAGVLLAIENHDRFSVADFERILETLDSPSLGICLDTVNSFGACEGPQVVVDTLGPWTVNLHIKDFVVRRADHQMGFAVDGTPAGEGMLNVPWLLDSIAAHGRNMSAILELWPRPAESMQATIACEALWAQQSVDYLRKLIAD